MFSKSLRAIQDFDEWLGEQPHRYKLVVPGNHEFFLEADSRRRSLLSNARVLIDEAVTIEGLRFYGSPMTPLYGGAFGKSSGPVRKRHWAKIPDDTHVLVTHGPPHGILDLSPGQLEGMGDPKLRCRIRELRLLRLHAFGHVHGAYGIVAIDGVTFANVALIGHLGEPVHKPLVIQMRAGKE
jgi:Icc-related predicted phosphoesterase